MEKAEHVVAATCVPQNNNSVQFYTISCVSNVHIASNKSMCNIKKISVRNMVDIKLWEYVCFPGCLEKGLPAQRIYNENI